MVKTTAKTNPFDSDDWLKRQTITSDAIFQQASTNQPIIFPWTNKPISFGTCYSTRRKAGEDPWIKDSPFMLSDLYTIPRVLHEELGSDATYHSINTARRSETGDHLSLGFGVSIGPAGLSSILSASVKGTFDKHVQNNSDSDKSSIRASVRAASVELARTPRLSIEAMATLKYAGVDAFTAQYGDYFVAGYRLGCDTALFISSSSFSKEEIDSYSIRASVTVLFFEAGHTWAKDFKTFDAGKAMKLSGYDTLGTRTWDVTTRGDGLEALMKAAEEVVLEAQNGMERTLGVLEARGLEDGMELTSEQCEYLSGSGVVVELVLLPMVMLRDVARWKNEDGII